MSSEDSLADNEAWLSWLATVEPTQRNRVARLVERADVDGWNGLHKLFGTMVAEVLRGNISPIVADTLMKLVDRQMAALFMEHKQANVLDAYPQSAAGTLLHLERLTASVQPLTPRYLEKDPGLDTSVLDAFEDSIPELPKIKIGKDS